MANRPVYEAITKAPFYQVVNVDFEYFPGFAVCQKQKCIASLHKSYLRRFSDRKILEISSKSTVETGVSLSAFNLKINKEGKTFPVECAYQGSKVFKSGGPYKDLLDKSPREAKKDERICSSGMPVAFSYFDKIFPIDPKNYFYNWLYINALASDEKLSAEILLYDSFTDIEFNPQKSINCQAKAAAVYVGLVKSGLLSEALASEEDFLRTLYGHA